MQCLGGARLSQQHQPSPVCTSVMVHICLDLLWTFHIHLPDTAPSLPPKVTRVSPPHKPEWTAPLPLSFLPCHPPRRRAGSPSIQGSARIHKQLPLHPPPHPHTHLGRRPKLLGVPGFQASSLSWAWGLSGHARIFRARQLSTTSALRSAGAG